MSGRVLTLTLTLTGGPRAGRRAPGHPRDAEEGQRPETQGSAPLEGPEQQQGHVGPPVAPGVMGRPRVPTLALWDAVRENSALWSLRVGSRWPAE